MRPQLTLRALAAALVFPGFIYLAQAAPGDLDTSFAGTGKSRLAFGFGPDFGRAVAVQPDGKLIVAGWTGQDWGGDFAVVRFDTNNVLDDSFGVGGKAHTPILSANDAFARANAVALQADGKIVLAGYANDGTNNNFALVRFHPDGSLDNSFGRGGIVTTDFGHHSQANAMVIQNDEKIVVAGWTETFALARYNSDGFLDASFGFGGKVITDANGDAGAYGVLLQPDGKILAVGTGGGDFALLRYSTNGLLDTTFGGGTGKVFTHLGYSNSVGRSLDQARAAVIQFGNISLLHDPDKIMVAGSAEDTSGHSVFGLARYYLDGSLDPSFGNGGKVTTSFSPASDGFGDLPYALLLQSFFQRPNTLIRKITVAGYGQSGTNTYFALARFDGFGGLDATFGAGTGKAAIQFGGGHDDEAYGLAIQGGKIVVAGSSRVNSGNTDFAAVRVNSDGSLDSSFGTGGIVTADIADRRSEAAATAVQSDGKIIVAGVAQNGSLRRVFALARYNTDGSLDASFGAHGKVTTSLGALDQVSSVTVQADGKIVAVGSSNNGSDADFALARYNPDGSLDASFGDNGKVITSFGAGYDQANAVRIQADRKILVAGTATSGGRSVFGLVRYNSNGSLDSSFGGTGTVTTSITGLGGDILSSLQIQNNGKIVAAGAAVVGTSYDFALARYELNGALDNSFGSFGRVATDISNESTDIATGMAIQPDGRIVLAGSTGFGGRVYVALVRYLPNGLLDSSFGQNGKVITQVGLAVDSAAAVALQPDGKIVAGGTSLIGANVEFAALRYNSDGSLDDAYGSGGKVVVDFGDGGNDTGHALAFDQIGRAVLVGDANGLFGVARLESEPFLKIQSVGRLPTGNILLQGLGFPARNHTLSGSATLSRGSFGPLSVVTPDAGGFWRYQDATVSGVNKRFYRLSLP